MQDALIAAFESTNDQLTKLVAEVSALRREMEEARRRTDATIRCTNVKIQLHELKSAVMITSYRPRCAVLKLRGLPRKNISVLDVRVPGDIALLKVMLLDSYSYDSDSDSDDPLPWLGDLRDRVGVTNHEVNYGEPRQLTLEIPVDLIDLIELVRAQ